MLSSQAYIFRDYWEDIGTLKTFYDASLALTAEACCKLPFMLLIICNELILTSSLHKPTD